MRSLPFPAARVVTVLVLAGCSLLLPHARAVEALLPDGRRLPGELLQDRDGRLRFQPVTQARSLPLDQLHEVRFPAVARPPLRAALVQRVLLRGGQQLTGELIDLSANRLSWRTSWADRLTLPRDAVAAVGHLPGFVTFFTEGFETDLKAWQVTGTPALSTGHRASGRRGLLLEASDQSTAYRLANGLTAGRAGIDFYDGRDAACTSVLVAIEFEGARGPEVLRVGPAEDAHAYEAEWPGGGGVRQRLVRSPGWHRLQVDFTPSSLLVTVDEAVLWYSRQRGPSGPLRNVRLARAAAESGACAEVAFDDFRLARAVETLPHKIEDVAQDELWLLAGDQLFGNVVRADRRGIDLEGRFGPRQVGWGEVRGVHLRQEIPPPRITQGEHVRLWLRAGSDGLLDQIEGAVETLTKDRLVLQHAALGRVELDRGRLHALRGVFHGRRIELDNGFHHLGSQVSARLDVPRPEGLSLRRSFRLDAVPAQAHFVVHAVALKGPGDAIVAALARGDRCTELVINGKQVAYLNRYVDKSSPTPRRLRVALPRPLLRVGENEVVLRQTPDRETGQVESCGVFGLAVEIQR
jgi:hypothetical protein